MNIEYGFVCGHLHLFVYSHLRKVRVHNMGTHED